MDKPDRKWREIYTDDESTWPEHGQWCQVVAFSEVRDMKFHGEINPHDFIQIECGFLCEPSGIITVGSREYASFGNILWRPIEGSGGTMTKLRVDKAK